VGQPPTVVAFKGYNAKVLPRAEHPHKLFELKINKLISLVLIKL